MKTVGTVVVALAAATAAGALADASTLTGRRTSWSACNGKRSGLFSAQR
jgi:hypothetical protein